MHYTKIQLEELINKISYLLTTDKPVMFDDVLCVKITPHTQLCKLWGVVKGSTGIISAYDGEKWFSIYPEQANVGYVLQSLYQRLKLIFN
jgi:hypothetical protein